MAAQIGVERQHHEGEVDVDQAHYDGEGGEQQGFRADSEPAKETVDALGGKSPEAEDAHPGIYANQEIAPERENDEQDQQVLSRDGALAIYIASGYASSAQNKVGSVA